MTSEAEGEITGCVRASRLVELSSECMNYCMSSGDIFTSRTRVRHNNVDQNFWVDNIIKFKHAFQLKSLKSLSAICKNFQKPPEI